MAELARREIRMEAFASARDTANAESFHRLCAAEPVLENVVPALHVVPGMTAGTILTSGPVLPWESYEGGQRQAIIGAAMFEGLAKNTEDADAKLKVGEIVIE